MSNSLRRTAVALALAVAAGPLFAQPASGPGPGASAPARGPGMGPGRGMMGPRAGAGITPGWTLMTPEERTAHRSAMQGMKSAEECRAFAQKHHEEMARRAQEKGQTLPGPRRDVCAGLKP